MSDEHEGDHESGVQKIGKAAAKVAHAATGSDPSAWFRALFVQTGAVGVVCWLVLRMHDSQAQHMEYLLEQIAENRVELREVEDRATERSAKQWERVRALTDAINDLARELRKK